MGCAPRYIRRRRLHTVPAQPAYRPFPIPGVRCQTLASQAALTSLGLAYELTATSSLLAVPALAEPGSRSCPGPGLAPGPRWPARLKSWARWSTCRYSSAPRLGHCSLHYNTPPRLTTLSPSHWNSGPASLFSSEIVCHSRVFHIFRGHHAAPEPALRIARRVQSACAHSHTRTKSASSRIPIAAAEGTGSISRSAESTPAQTTWAITAATCCTVPW